MCYKFSETKKTLQQNIKYYNEKQLAQVEQITHASRTEIIATVQLAQVKLEEIIQCLTKSKTVIDTIKNSD